MKISNIVLIVLLCISSVLWLSCASKSSSAQSTGNQTATVQRGNLTVDITAAGNLALSKTEDATFEMAGTVEEVLVEAGQSVEEGQVLATLNTSDWQDQITTLGRQLTTKKRDLLQAQINLQTAENSLGDIDEVKEAQDAVDKAKEDLDFAQRMFEKAIGLEATEAELRYWREQINGKVDVDGYEVGGAKQRLATAEADLREVLGGGSVPDDVAMQIQLKQMNVELAQGKLEDAQAAVEDAQKALDEAKIKSPEVKAPFAGFITSVSVKGGDEIKAGTVAVQLADPNKFKADILVSEMDILKIKVGGDAQVKVSASSSLSLPAKVTYIAPTATIQSGVVNYKVTVEVQTLETATSNQQSTASGPPSESSGSTPTPRQFSGTFGQRQSGTGAQSGQASAITSQSFQLRQGLTITVSLITAQRSNVLLVPNTAIKTQGGQAYVQVITSSGTPENRNIQTGISNYQYTEVTDGLSEGEKVVITKTTSTTTTTSTGQQRQQGGQGGIIVPGMGPMR